jgi:hypothetical protein
MRTAFGAMEKSAEAEGLYLHGGLNSPKQFRMRRTLRVALPYARTELYVDQPNVSKFASMDEAQTGLQGALYCTFRMIPR